MLVTHSARYYAPSAEAEASNPFAGMTLVFHRSCRLSGSSGTIRDSKIEMSVRNLKFKGVPLPWDGVVELRIRPWL